MKVKTLIEIQSAKGIIPAGQIIDIPPAVMEKLQGKVEPVTDTPQFHGAAEIVTPGCDRIWIATEPGAVKLIPSGAACFLGDEIIQLQKTGPEMARAALMVKQVFGSSARITEAEPI